MKNNRSFPQRWTALFGLLAWLTACLASAQAQAPYAKAGWQATLSTAAHGVRGTATILDADTYRVDNFFYDGGGITVYFYLGATDTRQAFTNGLSTGPNLLGTAYNGGSLTIDLPPGQTFDNYRAISVWCTAAGVSFGSGTFAPYARAGWEAPLATFGHGVRGTVTIVDADTFRVDNFHYDGRGISVFFYLGTSDLRTAFSAGLQTGPQLLRSTPYVNESLTIDLPPGRTLADFQAISVWCVAAGANFGSGTFVSPRENWRRTHFANTANTGNGADMTDFDLDGQPNLLEYATLTDPKNPGVTPFTAPALVSPSSLQLTFNYRPESRDIRYLVLSSPDLKTWTEVYRNDPRTGNITRSSSITSQENPTARTITLTSPVPVPTLFWRLAVDPAP
jgi:Electron transfer DM13